MIYIIIFVARQLQMIVVRVFIDNQEHMLAASLLITLACKTSIRGWHILTCLCSQTPCESEYT